MDKLPLTAPKVQDQKPASAGTPLSPPDLMSAVMTAAGPSAPQVATIAARYGIKEDDPAWILAAAVRDATAAGAAATTAATRIESATQGISDQIYKTTVAAGADLKAGVAQAIEAKTVEAGQALVGAIAHAAGKGAADLQKAAAGLDRMGAEKAAAFIEQWKVHLAHAIKEQAKASLAWKLAQGWGVVVALLAGMFVFGMLTMTGIGILSHRVILSPEVTYHRAAAGNPPQLNFVGPLYRAASCPPGEACLALTNVNN